MIEVDAPLLLDGKENKEINSSYKWIMMFVDSKHMKLSNINKSQCRIIRVIMGVRVSHCHTYSSTVNQLVRSEGGTEINYSKIILSIFFLINGYVFDDE